MKLKTVPKWDQKPKPCRICGNEDPVFWQLPGANWIECPKCKTTIPMEDSSIVALRKWNSMKTAKN